jgi:hypothetical protein
MFSLKAVPGKACISGVTGQYAIRKVLTTRRSGRELHRQWPDEVKAQRVSESLRPDAMVSQSDMA